MITPGIPKDEKERLSALLAYDILDSEAEEDFDDIVKLASMVCGTDSSLISLVDEKRQWFKAKTGHIESTETPRDIAFCAHAILGEDEFVVPDAAADDRFHDNPLVLENIVRFYAGTPLTNSNGYNLGTLCVIDRQPTRITEEQLFALKVLGKQVMNRIELRRKIVQLDEKISELAESLEREKAAKEEADRANALKSKFLAHVSHEIRTPLHGIQGIIDFLKDTSLDKRQKEYLSILNSSSKMLRSITDNVLDLCKIESGKWEVHLAPFQIKDTIQELYNLYSPYAKQKGLHFHLNITENLPDIIVGDKLSTQQILGNLITNALKFTEVGEVNLEIEVIEFQDKEIKLKFSIKDTGIGIGEDLKEKLFQEWMRGKQEKREIIEGTGLGTTIMKNLINLLGGDLGFVSPLYDQHSSGGPGSEFWVIIPFTLAVEELKDPIPIIKKDSIGNKTPFNPELKILVAEDHPVNQFIIKKHLKKMGYNCDIVGNGAEVLKKLEEKTYDIIFMDINMPVMDGLTATVHIRTSLKSDIPIIALTANAFEEDIEVYKREGMNDCVRKPFNKEDIQKVIHTYLNPSSTKPLFLL